MKIRALTVAAVLTCSTPALPLDDQTTAFDSRMIANLESIDILVEGDEAEVPLRNAWGFQPDAAIYLKKQEGAWRIDLPRYLAQFAPVGVIVNDEAADGPDIGEEIMRFSITLITGCAPNPNIWNRPG